MDELKVEILLVEDEIAHIELIQRAFESRGTAFHLTTAQTLSQAQSEIKRVSPALIITDWRLPDGEGTQLIVSADGMPMVPVIVMTSHGNERVAVEALKAGAMDYVVKTDASLADMPHIVERVLREWDNRLRRVEAESALRRRVSELEAVNRISTSLRTATAVNNILPRVLDETMATLQAEAGAIWLYKADAGKLYPACARGWLVEKAKAPIEYGKCIAGFVFISGQPRVSVEFATDPLAHEGNAKNYLHGWGGAWVPVLTADQVVGILLVALQAPRQVTQDELHLLTTVAEIAGNTIHRANLSEQTERHIKRLNALRAIDMAITSSTNLTLSLNVLLSQTLTLLGSQAATILRLNPDTQVLELLAERSTGKPISSKTRIRLGHGLAGLSALERRTISIPNLSKVTTTDDQVENHLEMKRIEAFGAYHVTPLTTRGYIKGVLEVFHDSPFQSTTEWKETLEALAGQAAIAIDNAELFEGLEKSNFQLRMAYDATIEGWSRALDLRDRETEGHTQRVTEMTVQLARLMNISENEVTHIRRGALLHDIGKMGIPDSILLKPGPLTDEEWDTMRQHPMYAKTLISSIEYLRPAVDIPYSHHEHWDGSGYPLGLQGEQIPLSARIFSVVDVWDALRSDRPYRAAWPARQIEDHIRANTSKLFDPQVVKLFLQKVAK